MRIAVAQINTQPGDFGGTSRRVVDLSHRALAEGAQLLVLPFLTFTGTRFPGYANEEGFGIDLAEALSSLAQDVACPCVVPISSAVGSDVMTDAILLRDGVQTQLRVGGGLAGKGNSTSLDDPAGLFFELDGIRFAVAFDYDDLDLYIATDVDVDAVLFIPRSGFAVDDSASALGAALAENRFHDDAWTLDAWMIGVGSIGCSELSVFTGSSFALSPKGELKADAPSFEEALMFVNMEEDAGDILDPELYDRSFYLWETLTLGLRDFLAKLNVLHVVLELDGSLGSSVLAALASDALGPKSVHGLVSLGIDEDRRRVVEQLAQSLRLDVEMDRRDDVLIPSDRCAVWDLNQTRLAAAAREHDACVLSSMDKTFWAMEVKTGRCEAALLAPLGDVYRSDVLRMARVRNTVSPVILAQSLQWYDVPFIDGLSEIEPTKEACLERIDVTLATHIEWGRSISDVVSRQSYPELSARILSSFEERRSARLMAPPCIVVSSCTLREVEIPFGITWSDRVRTDEERGTASAPLASVRGAIAVMHDEGGTHEVDMSSSDVSALLEQLQDEVLRRGDNSPLPEDLERQVDEVLGLIRDVLQNGGQVTGNSDNVPFGPLTWGSPFSEN